MSHPYTIRSMRNSQKSTLKIALSLYEMWQSGGLGGATMPEDVRPDLSKSSSKLLHFLTLGMCLNYQRNSYVLWQACRDTYDDNKVNWVFKPEVVALKSHHELRIALLKHKVALQPNKHIDNWHRVAIGMVKFGQGDMRNILQKQQFDIALIRDFIQHNRKNFPYLAGDKICNYWLFVLLQYTDFPLTNRQALSIAPDTHILKASLQLGLISQAELANSKAQQICAKSWRILLNDSGLLPIDMHTPLWLWSRAGFPPVQT